MNFAHMPELASRCGYVVVIGVTVVICAGVFSALRRARWL